MTAGGISKPAPMPQTDRVMAGLLDMRLPLTFSVADCELIARIIRGEVGAVFQGHRSGTAQAREELADG